MPSDNILSQDEIDALLTGMDGGEVETHAEHEASLQGVSGYDFESEDRIVRGRLPTLEIINERFARSLRATLFNILRRTPSLSVASVQMLKYSEYVQGLFLPASMNLVKVPPLQGTALFTLDHKLVFALVDSFFGGSGAVQGQTEERDFTATEQRVVKLLLDHVFVDLRRAWEAVYPLDFQFGSTEVNPMFANIVSPSEVVVVNAFEIELDGAGGGGLHLTYPYAMLEPIREILETGLQSDATQTDERWGKALRAEIEFIDVELAAQLGETQITLRRLLTLKAGEVIPIELPEMVTATVEGIPLLRGKFGASGGNLAIKVKETIGGTSRALTPIAGVGP